LKLSVFKKLCKLKQLWTEDNKFDCNFNQALQCSVFFYTYTPVYTRNFQKLHLHNTLCKIKTGVLKKNWCSIKCFFIPKKIGTKLLHWVIFGVFFEKKTMKEVIINWKTLKCKKNRCLHRVYTLGVFLLGIAVR
jgi:hypothetical protein